MSNHKELTEKDEQELARKVLNRHIHNGQHGAYADIPPTANARAMHAMQESTRSEYENFLDLGDTAAFWHMLDAIGEGSVYEGRLRLMRVAREDPELFRAVMGMHVEAALKYAKKLFPKSPTLDLQPRTLLLYFSAMMGSGYGNTLLLFLRAYWYDQGLPNIQVGHKLAASMMLTAVSEDVLAEVQFPFKCFTIDVPDGMLFLADETKGTPVAVKTILVGKHLASGGIDGVAYVAVTESTACSWSLQEDMQKLLGTGGVVGHNQGPLDFEADPLDDRTALMVKRLIANVCLYMTHGNPQKPVGNGHKTWKGTPRQSTAPTKRVFRLTHEVVHNFKQVVSEYVSGVSKKMTVQSVVTGHWKLQAHGPQHSLRKRIFVEPYWRGPEDAPIAVRAHKLEER